MFRRLIHTIVLATLVLSWLHASPHDDVPIYSSVRVLIQDAHELRLLQERGVNIDHYRGKPGSGIEVVVNQDELQLIRQLGLPVEVLLPELGAYHAGLPEPSQAEKQEWLRSMASDGVAGFGYGSMGGFFTYAEVVQRLDSMALQYPHLITPKFSIGTSPEGRTIWAVEISDNPGVTEPGEPVVYFDALHHAREPMSMAVLMYFMYWLLDNYGTNPEATLLVNSRRLCFVPVVNPDGYVYNQTTNPNGGGGWRKNRSYNFDGSRGVDLNRNYAFRWGYDDQGSSPTPSSEIYRGPTPESESETRAVRDYVLLVQPTIAFTTHSVAGRYLNPYGYADTVVAFENYAEFAGDFSDQNQYLYGTVFQMLNYNSNGTTRDFLHSIGCLAWTPEIGGSGFWPAQSEIIPLAQENLFACRYLAWVSGGYANFQSHEIAGRGFVVPGDTIALVTAIRNKGLILDAESVAVIVQPLTVGVQTVEGTIPFPPIPPRQTATNDSTPFLFLIPTGLPAGTELSFLCTVTQQGVVTHRDTFSVVVGYPDVLFSDNAETGVSHWLRSGSGVAWDTAFTMARSGTHSFADSRYGNVANSTNNQFTLASQVSLAGVQNPRLEYYARWANELNADYVRVQLSTNNGSTWTSLAGKHTRQVGGQPAYTGNRGRWVRESINLGTYGDRQIRVRFTMTTDASLRGDGFYFDDFRIVDYRDTTFTDVGEPEERPSTFSLEQNYPNPFNPLTQIRFGLPSTDRVVLRVYNILGEEIARPVEAVLPAGYHTANWDGRTLTGGIASSGVYFYRLETGSSAGTGIRKMLLMK